MTHSTRGHECELCGRTMFGNGGKVSHGRSHVRKGEAVELVKEYPIYPPMTTRLFLRPTDDLARFLSEGFVVRAAATGDSG